MRKILLFMLVLSFVNLLPAQEKDTTYKYWMTIGVMIVNWDFTGNFNYTFSLNDNFYKVNYLTKGADVIAQQQLPGREGIFYNSIDVSIGKRIKSKWFQASFFAGPAYVYGEKYIDTNRKDKFKTAGLQMDAQFLFRLANEVGIGVGLFANLNFEKNFMGFDVNITLGNGK